MVLAPKLSVFNRLFAREDVDVAAIYMETCDGVPDAAAAIRDQIAKHKLEYAVFDDKAGKLDDPTRKKYPWAPHGLIVDRNGVIVKEYGHLPGLDAIESDLRDLLSLGMIPEGPADGWRDVAKRSWVEIQFEGAAGAGVEAGAEAGAEGGARIETRTLTQTNRNEIVLSVATVYASGHKAASKSNLALAPLDPVRKDFVRKRAKDSSLDIDGQIHPCRVIEESWTSDGSFTRRSWIAANPQLPDQLLRQETTRSKDGVEQRVVRRIHTFRDAVMIGEREVTCWVVETTTAGDRGGTRVTRWRSAAVPGREVKSARAVDGKPRASSFVTSRVLGFGVGIAGKSK